MKRIIICADGTWNRPERLNNEDYPTNVLKFSRAVAPTDTHGIGQIVFYDWGIGSYHDKYTGGGMGLGLEKNVMDCYRFLVHNYQVGDEIFLFGFSRGAYTVRSLCGMINNCSILKSAEAERIEEAFSLYKTKTHKPSDTFSRQWREQYSLQQEVKINFIGVWDTVGALGLPFSFFGLIKDKDLFYDRQMGSNIVVARHALSLDELRDDFEPTLWEPRDGTDLKQVWFAGVHCDVGGSYKPDSDQSVLADIPYSWMMKEAEAFGLHFEDEFKTVTLNPLASQHNEYKGKYKLLGKKQRVIPDPDSIPSFIHDSLKTRYQSGYTSAAIEAYVKRYEVWPPIEH